MNGAEAVFFALVIAWGSMFVALALWLGRKGDDL